MVRDGRTSGPRCHRSKVTPFDAGGRAWPSTPLLPGPEQVLPTSQAIHGKKASIVATHSVSCSSRTLPSIFTIN